MVKQKALNIGLYLKLLPVNLLDAVDCDHTKKTNMKQGFICFLNFGDRAMLSKQLPL